MSALVVGSVRGAPGVTTAAEVLVGCLTNGVLVDADLNGGTVALRHRLGRSPGLTTLAAARSTTALGWRDHAQVADGVPMLVGPDSPKNAVALWSRAGPQLAKALALADADLVVDAGRLDPTGPLRPLLSVAALVVVLVRPEAEDLVGLAHRLPALQEHSASVGAVLVGRGTYEPQAVTEQLGVEVLDVFPADARQAVLHANSRRSGAQVAASELKRAARRVVAAYVARTGGERDPDDVERAGSSEEAVP